MDMKFSDWLDVNRPKIDGTWNLHRSLEGQQLDFFWLASSILTAVDQPGQGNYLATGTFLEAFCQFRHSLHLPASVLNICPIDGVGFVAENPQARRNMKAQGIYTLGESEFLEFLELGLDSQVSSENSAPTASPPIPWVNNSQVLMGLRSELDLADPNNRASWRHNRRMGIYHNILPGDGIDRNDQNTEQSALKKFLASVTENADDGDVGILTSGDSIEFLALEIGKKIHDLMLKPDEEVNISLTLVQIGLDSLMAIELVRWIKQVFGLSISVLEIMASGSLKALSGNVAAKFAEKMQI